MDDAARLLAIEHIKIVKANYFLGVDTKDWDLLRRQVFCDETVFELPEFGEEPFVGPETVLTFFAEAMSDWVSVHHGHTPIISITSDRTATGIWAMEDRIWGQPGTAVSSIHGFGHYHENYVRLDALGSGGWRIGRFRLTRLRVETGRIF